MLRTIRHYPTLTPVPARGPLPPMVGVVIPIARTNIVTNPSIELATTGYTAVGGSIARSATQQYHGTYSLAVTPGAGTTDGAYYATSLTSGVIYAFSCKVKGIAGIPYKISLASTAPADLAVFTFIGTGRWQWVSGYYAETSSASRRFYFTKNGSTNTGVFYIDGVQIEAINAGETVSTYIDGDQLGLLVGQQPPAYLWTGTPHASTSTRSALTRAGGYVVNLSLYNFLLTGLIGLGMAAPNNVSIPYTVLDGARYQRTTKPPRTLSLTGRWQSGDPREQFFYASDMRQAFDRDLVPLQQPMVLTVEPQDECGQAIGDFAQVQCIYAGGLEGNDGNVPVEDIAPTFTLYVPYLIGGSGGAALTAQLSVSNADYMAVRSITGLWSAVGALNGTVNTIVVGPDGLIYVGGNFTNAGGVAAADYIAVWNGSSFSALGTGGDAQVFAIAFDGAGSLYAAGSFTLMGGVANTSRIAKWNGSAWSALSTGLSGIGASGRALAIDSSNNVYVGGNFTDAGGSGADYIARWDGAAFQVLALSTALNGQVNALQIDPADNLYVGGAFTNASSLPAADYIAAWSLTNGWSAVGPGMNNTVQTIARGPNGIIYAGGDFTAIGSLTISYVAQWNGTGWSSLGTLNNVVTRMNVGRGGQVLYVSGDFTTANGITLPDRAAVWNGSTWLPLDIDLPGAASVSVVTTAPDGTLYIGYKAAGTATAAAITSVTNDTPGYVWPKLTITGPSSGTSRIYQCINYTTGFGIWLNLTLSPGEVATLDFNPQAPSFTTTFQGDISSKVLPGSQPALMYLAQGNNSISFFAASSTVTATLSWQKRYNGLADLVN